MTVPLAKDSRMGPLTMRELMYAPVGGLAGVDRPGCGGGSESMEG